LISRGTIAWRMSLLMALGSGVAIAFIVGAGAVYSRRVLEKELEAKARALGTATAYRIDAVERAVAKTAEGLALAMEHMPLQRDALGPLLLDVLTGYLALYFTDVIGLTVAQAGVMLSVLMGASLVSNIVLIPLLEKICAEFFSKDKNAQAFRTLFWGRLEPDTPNGSRELSLRLALAAYKSPGWDTKKGKPKNGDINGFVKDLANKEMIYPELKKLFERFHKSIKFSCAEKVLVLKTDKLPFYEQLKQQGVKAADKLPFDCMTWFTIAAQ